MLLPITENDAIAQGLRIEGQIVFAADGSAVGDYVSESGLVRLDVSRCSLRPMVAGGYPVTLGGLPITPCGMALLGARLDHWARN
jgi:hypothetical protein